MEKAQSQEKAQKTRRVPTVSCTLCWAPWLSLPSPQLIAVFGSGACRGLFIRKENYIG
jgi:hypothetical protein